MEPRLGARLTERNPSVAMVAVVLPAATREPPAVVNEGQLISTVPEPG